MRKVKLNIEIEISEEKYNEMIENLNDVSGFDSKEDLEVYIGSGVENEIEENVYGLFLFGE